MKLFGPNSRPERGSVVTIGAFDGVHVGHRALIDSVKQQASELGCASAVVTFDRHPAAVVRPESAPKLLTDLDQKLELLSSTGIDYTFVIEFDEQRSSETAEQFIQEILVNRLNAHAVIVGHDFHFGKDRLGNVEMLRVAGENHGFDVQQKSAVASDGVVISSTEIRRTLVQGDVERASALLGRPYEVRGLVMMGDGRGRELGFPTANVHLSADILLPADGVYAGEYVMDDGEVKKTAISLGTRPQFYEDGAVLLEAYVLDFDGDLYGHHAKIRFTHRIRGQQKFDSLDSLIAQIEADVAQVKSS